MLLLKRLIRPNLLPREAELAGDLGQQVSSHPRNAGQALLQHHLQHGGAIEHRIRPAQKLGTFQLTLISFLLRLNSASVSPARELTV